MRTAHQVIATFLLLVVVLAVGQLRAMAQVPDRYVVKVAYIVPADRKPLPGYRLRMDFVMKEIQRFYADQMEVHGFGRRTFTLDTGQDGLVNVSYIAARRKTAEFDPYHQVAYQNSKFVEYIHEAVQEGGIDEFQRGVVLVTFLESQLQNEDGGILGATNGGAPFFQGGSCLNTTTALYLSTSLYLHDGRPYDGLVLPPIGPKALQLGKSFPNYEGGSSVNSLAGTQMGAIAHEMGHCFQLAHCGINDLVQNGNMMGAGFRGWRGWYLPETYPNEESRFDRPSAVILSLSPFFRTATERVPAKRAPVVEITTLPGEMKIENGAFRLSFTAEQPAGPGIAFATLENGSRRDGVGVVAYQDFRGYPTQVNATFETGAIVPGREDTWRLCVYDRAGTQTETLIKMVAPERKFAPNPSIRIGQTRVKVGVPISLSASAQGQPGNTFVWSFGDGSTTTGKRVEHQFDKVGNYEIKVTVTDAAGEKGESSIFVMVKTEAPRDR